MGSVVDRLSPALPRQTVHAVLQRTAFRCSAYRAMCLVLLGTFASACFGGESECTRLDARAGGPEDNYRPPLEAAVIGKGRLNFHSAPSNRCQMKGVFVIGGDVLTVYKSFEGWANVMYIARNGDDFMGWVLEKRIKKIGQYGHNP